MAEILLKKLHGSLAPSRIMATYWDGKCVAVQRWTTKDGKPTRKTMLGFSDPAMWWGWLAQQFAHGNKWTIFGWKMYSMLCGLGIYDQVDSESWSFSGVSNPVLDADGKKQSSRKWGSMILENPPTMVDLGHHLGGTATFIDLANYGMHQHMFLDSSENECVETAAQAIECYLALVRLAGLGSLRGTIAAQAACCYRTHWMDHEIIANDDPAVRRLERDSYYSGRAEAFRIGRLPGVIYHVDVKAMYNTLAKNGLFPSRLRIIAEDLDTAIRFATNERAMAIADVVVRINSPYLPCRYNGRVIFPSGEFRTVLAGPELLWAYSAGDVVECHSVQVYETELLFSSWSSFIAKLRDSLDFHVLGHLKPVVKLLGNTLYGKLGSRGKNWSNWDESHAPDRWGQWFAKHPTGNHVTQCRAIAGQIQYLDGNQEPATSCPAIPATMNAMGRMRLQSLMLMAGKENVHYVDTDGLMVNQAGFDRLSAKGQISPGVDGLLSIREVSDDVEIYGIKHYRFGERLCCAGQIAECDQPKSYETRIVQQEPFEVGMRAKDPLKPISHDIRRRKDAPYNHGKVDVDGSIAPFVMAPIVLEGSDENGRAVTSTVYEIVGSERKLDRQPDSDGALPTADYDGSYRSD